ncbi:50S ribosomal protein L34 [Candidatus Omnitrophota bacterium]
MKKNLKTPTKIVKKRRHGFRRRMKARTGRKLIARRRLKGRRRLAV